MSLSYKHVQSLFIGILIGLVCIPLVYAERALMQVDMDTGNKPRLQNGAKVFMNYCSGCHALGYLRYNRMAQDLGLTTGNGQVDQDLLINNLVFTQAPIYAPIEIAMPTVSARQWFGAVPPDLSLIARQHSAEWLYTYLLSFYEDRTRPFGSNNALVPNVAMPNVFAPLTGRVLAMHEKKNRRLKRPQTLFYGKWGHAGLRI